MGLFVSYFDIVEVPRSLGKWNWNWLYFLPFIFTFEQGANGSFRILKKTGGNFYNLTSTPYTGK